MERVALAQRKLRGAGRERPERGRRYQWGERYMGGAGRWRDAPASVAKLARAALERTGTKMAEPKRPSAKPSSHGWPGLRHSTSHHTLSLCARSRSYSKRTRGWSLCTRYERKMVSRRHRRHRRHASHATRPARSRAKRAPPAAMVSTMGIGSEPGASDT
jgi:hypothetical protein